MAIWKEIDARFVKNNRGGILMAEDVSAVMSSIHNILTTRKGERIMLRSFGSSLADMLFEPMSASILTRMSDTIKRDIETWDNRPLINSVSYGQLPDRNTVELTIEFSIRGYPDIFIYKQPIKVIENS